MRRAAFAGAVSLLVALAGCRTARPAGPGDERFLGEGVASYYGKGFHGRPTASGEPFDKGAMTAAHRKLKFHSCVEVENLANGRRVQVRINDRGPYARGRIIDVSEAAGRKLGMLESGLARVRLYRCG